MNTAISKLIQLNAIKELREKYASEYLYRSTEHYSALNVSKSCSETICDITEDYVYNTLGKAALDPEDLSGFYSTIIELVRESSSISENNKISEKKREKLEAMMAYRALILVGSNRDHLLSDRFLEEMYASTLSPCTGQLIETYAKRMAHFERNWMEDLNFRAFGRHKESDYVDLLNVSLNNFMDAETSNSSSEVILQRREQLIKMLDMFPLGSENVRHLVTINESAIKHHPTGNVFRILYNKYRMFGPFGHILNDIKNRPFLMEFDAMETIAGSYRKGSLFTHPDWTLCAKCSTEEELKKAADIMGLCEGEGSNKVLRVASGINSGNFELLDIYDDDFIVDICSSLCAKNLISRRKLEKVESYMERRNSAELNLTQ